jgi:hypothetical protein
MRQLRRHATFRPLEPAVTISMIDDVVVVRPRPPLDLDATDALVDAVASVVASGATVMLALHEDTTGAHVSSTFDRDDAVQAPDPVDHGRGTARAFLPGFVRLDSGRGTWTLDLLAGRLCRSEGPVKPSFVQPGEWIGIEAIWVTRSRFRVLTSDGVYLTANMAWTSDAHAPRNPPPTSPRRERERAGRVAA